MAANIGLASYVEKVNGTEHGSNAKRTDEAISFLLIIQFDISSEFWSSEVVRSPLSRFLNWRLDTRLSRQLDDEF